MTVVTMTVAAAASLGTAGRTEGAGSTGVAACDPDGFTFSFTTAAGNVTAAQVDGIADPGCEGGSLRLVLTDGGDRVAEGGPVTVPTDGDTTANSVSVTLSPNPGAETIDGVRVAIAGP